MLLKTVSSILSNFDLLSCKSGINWDDVEMAFSRDFSEFIPLVGKVHSDTGKPLYKMTGKSGSRLLYTDHGVLYCLMDDGNWNPIAVSEALDLIF